MEDDYRRLQPVKLDIIGNEEGRERYSKDGWVAEPQIAVRRNNLTACSQRHNLYFVAHEDIVAVFQPSSPSHILGGQPHLNIVPTLANPNAGGYQNFWRPHDLNHLLVGELGSEEILFFSTDSGNVAAYYTAGIQEGIEKDPYKISKDSLSDLVGVRPFFTHWVHESAWGLAIHKRARMLAVSSNKPDPSGVNATVTVFAFALTSIDDKSSRTSQDETTSAEEESSEWKLWIPDGIALPDRSCNWTTRLTAHRHNIPSLAFINSDDDREGNYLLSTDIGGIAKCSHIWYGNATHTWDFAPPMPRSSNSYLSSRPLSGWAVLPLDPSSFQVVNTTEEFCGDPTNDEDLLGYLDITQSLYRVPGHDRSLPADSAVSSADENDHDESDSVSNPFNEDDFANEDDQDVTAVGLLPQLRGSNSVDSSSMHRHMRSSSDEPNRVEGETSDVDSGEEIPRRNFVSLDRELEGDGSVFMDWADLDPPDRSNSGEVFATQHNVNGAKKPKLHHEGARLATERSLRNSKAPVVPTLHLSALHLRLFDANSPREASLYCSDLLHLQGPMHPAADRLNMTQYVPELGIVVIGTQAGRVAVCSLTRKGSKGRFGLRVDWILPFKAQENRGERPLAPLLGIAVGPAEGHQLSRSSSVFSDDRDMEQTWLHDRIDDDGVPISFDPEVVRLRRHGSESSSSSNDNSQPSDAEAPIALGAKYPSGGDKRRTDRKCSHSPRSELMGRAWPSRSEFKEARAVTGERWRGLEYSRRYRLLLTYSNHTVLTYELSRGAPFVGLPTFGRPNWRNRDEPL